MKTSLSLVFFFFPRTQFKNQPSKTNSQMQNNNNNHNFYPHILLLKRRKNKTFDNEQLMFLLFQ